MPQVNDRPLLRFVGTIASDEPVETYFGERQSILTAIMTPGASGSPVFTADGNLAGLVSQSLEGVYTDSHEGRYHAVCHAFVPADVILAEVPSLDPSVKYLNQFKSSDEVKAAERRPPSS